jgi:hypothetical protein
VVAFPGQVKTKNTKNNYKMKNTNLKLNTNSENCFLVRGGGWLG